MKSGKKKAPLTESLTISSKRLRQSLMNAIESYIHYYIVKVGEIPSHRLRNCIYRHVFRVKMGKKVVIYHGAEIREPFRLQLGEGTIIGDNAILDARYGIHIGKNVNASSNISIWTEQHDHRDPWFRCNPERLGPVTVGDRVWIGPNVIILPTVTIGEGAVLAAGAVVTGDVEPFAIVGGIPARKIGERNHELRYEFNGKHRYFL